MGPPWSPSGSSRSQMGPHIGPMNLAIREATIQILLMTQYKRQFDVTWASCQIRKIASCACAGNAGNDFPATVSFARATMHPGIANWRFALKSVSRKNFPGIPGACTTHNLTYLLRGPCLSVSNLMIHKFLQVVHSDSRSYLFQAHHTYFFRKKTPVDVRSLSKFKWTAVKSRIV